MDIEENNLNERVDEVAGAIDLINSLIEDIGTDNLSEERANVMLFNTRESLKDLRLRLQDFQDAHLHHQHSPQPQQPQEPPQGEGMLAHGNPWVDKMIEDWGGYEVFDTHVVQLKSFLTHLKQTIGDDNLFRVSFTYSQAGPSHIPIFTTDVEVVFFMNNPHQERTFSAEGHGNTKKEAEKNALFNLFENERVDMYHLCCNLYEPRHR